jgi:hypothetical protein
LGLEDLVMDLSVVEMDDFKAELDATALYVRRHGDFDLTRGSKLHRWICISSDEGLSGGLLYHGRCGRCLCRANSRNEPQEV